MPAPAEHLERGEAPLGRVEQVAQHHHHSAPAGLLRREVQRSGEVGRTAPHGRIETAEHLLHVARGRGEWKEAPHAGRQPLRATGVRVPGDDQSHLVALPHEKVGERPGADSAVLELGHRAAAVGHRPGAVHDQQRTEVRLHLEALDVVLVELGVGAPIDVLDLVAGRVLLVLDELDRLAVGGALVQSGEDALHHLAGTYLQRPEPGEERGIERHAR